MQICGKRYLIEHCISELKKQNENKAYRAYVTDALKIIAKNTAKFAGGQFLKRRYTDVIDPPAADNKTAEEIAAEIIKEAGLVVR